MDPNRYSDRDSGSLARPNDVQVGPRGEKRRQPGLDIRHFALILSVPCRRERAGADRARDVIGTREKVLPWRQTCSCDLDQIVLRVDAVVSLVGSAVFRSTISDEQWVNRRHEPMGGRQTGGVAMQLPARCGFDPIRASRDALSFNGGFPLPSAFPAAPGTVGMFGTSAESSQPSAPPSRPASRAAMRDTTNDIHDPSRTIITCGRFAPSLYHRIEAKTAAPISGFRRRQPP
jgi:hypothetical protein